MDGKGRRALRLGWWSTGRGEGSRGLLRAVHGTIAAGDLNASIEYVFSNREQGEAEGSDEFFRMVESMGIPLVRLSSQRFRRERGGGGMAHHRNAYHDEAMRLTAKYETDLSVLAGYMLITSPRMCRERTMINLHPALPDAPAGMWQDVIWQLIESGAAQHGAMLHLATEVLDAGPTLSYCSFPIRDSELAPLWSQFDSVGLDAARADGERQPLFAEIRRRGVARERPLLVATVIALAEGSIRIEGGRPHGPRGPIDGGLCMNDEVERLMQAWREIPRAPGIRGG